MTASQNTIELNAPAAAVAFARIDSLSHDSRGVARNDGKAVFVDGALPAEEVLFNYQKRRAKFDEGKLSYIVKASPDRVEPRCKHFGVCGGCSLQHLAAEKQIVIKQQIIVDNLKHIGKVVAQQVLPLLSTEHWGYRRKARLGVKFVVKKDTVLVGFREKKTAFLAELDSCAVLHPMIGTRISALRTLIAGLQAYREIPQIEVAVGDNSAALVIRHLVPLVSGDREKLRAFADETGLQIYLQPAGPDSVEPLSVGDGRLSYHLSAHEIEISFLPTDFTQVNAGTNRLMVDRVMDLLQLQPTDRVLDLFCGLGNFTLPIARRAATVIGIEGEGGLVTRAQKNAQNNGISNAQFVCADLSKPLVAQLHDGTFDKILLDPPRTGAEEIVERLPAFNPSRIVYVSCNPATLARDASVLVHQHGYELLQVGAIDMFPHTAHVEAVALFEKR